MVDLTLGATIQDPKAGIEKMLNTGSQPNRMAEKENNKNISGRSAKKWRLGDYLLQVSVVVIGILITFQGTAWIERRSQRNQMKEILQSVRNEMAYNLRVMENTIRVVKFELEATDFFSRHVREIGKAPADSIGRYIPTLENNMRFFINSDALEVLKASTSSVNVIDKELLQGIFSCYNAVDMLYLNVNYYYTEKEGIQKAFYASTDIDITKDPAKNRVLYLRNYFGTPAARNFLTGASFMLAPNIPLMETVADNYREAIEIINDYIK